jgi:accessory colonization factor AcfC
MVLGMGCAAPLKQVEPPPSEPIPEHYHPAWTSAVSVYVDAISACLDQRQSPSAVVHVEALAKKGTGVTVVDGYGVLEDCIFRGGQVERSDPAMLAPEALVGLPLFALGSEEPVLELQIPREEVLQDDAVIGWLYWPREARGRQEGKTR